jgi:hypothetical protein
VPVKYTRLVKIVTYMCRMRDGEKNIERAELERMKITYD